MATVWPPRKDADFALYMAAYAATITTAPTTWGLVAADATAATAAATALTAAMAAANNPSTRTKANVASKDLCKGQALALLRSQVKRIQATPTVTAAMKESIGIPIHDAVPSPLPAPTTPPVLTLVGIGQRSQVLRIADSTTPDKKARPFGTSGAQIFAYTGEGDPPADVRAWTFVGLATKNQYVVDGWTAADDGKPLRLAARWFNDRGEVGPLSFPIAAPIAA